jgi:purine-cytosine permease-like protein
MKTCIQLFGAAVGSAVVNATSCSDAYTNFSVGGLIETMLSPAGGFGNFLTVLVALIVMGNIAATLYSVSLNLQIILPVLVVVTRYIFSIIATAMFVPFDLDICSFCVTLSAS